METKYFIILIIVIITLYIFCFITNSGNNIIKDVNITHPASW